MEAEERHNGVVHAAAMTFDLHVPESRSLKAKRAVIRPIVDGLRHRFRISVAEVDHLDQWQRAEIGIVAVSSSATLVAQVVDDAERCVWSFPEVEVTDARRSWLED